MQSIRGRVIWKPKILTAIAAAKAYAIKKAVGIAKAAWKHGQRGWRLRHKIREAILKRVLFNDHPRVQRAAEDAAFMLVFGYLVPTPRHQWCFGRAFTVTKGTFWYTMLRG